MLKVQATSLKLDRKAGGDCLSGELFLHSPVGWAPDPCPQMSDHGKDMPRDKI